MSAPQPLPQRIAGEWVTLRKAEGEGVVRYEVRRRGQRDVVGEVSVDLAGDVPFIERLCIDEEARGYGAGSGAATALLKALRRRYPVVRTWAPPDRGLAVYFWVRMGFRPLHGEGPDGGLWFEQVLRPSRARRRGRQRG
ncbi:MAG: hypothetical protein F4X03_07915 [Dehalococcoidia bacterium]|nr:hypothetical protein [Dehalococcoidia bacterium]